MGCLEDITEKVHDGYFVDLFVRASNAVAINMYTKVLDFTIYQPVSNVPVSNVNPFYIYTDHPLDGRFLASGLDVSTTEFLSQGFGDATRLLRNLPCV